MNYLFVRTTERYEEDGRAKEKTREKEGGTRAGEEEEEEEEEEEKERRKHVPENIYKGCWVHSSFSDWT